MQVFNISNRLFTTALLVSAAALSFFTSAQVHAEYLGFPSGRSANVASLPNASVEAGFLTGDIGENSYQSFGGRFSLRTSSLLQAYVDLVQADVEDFDGLGFGAGVFYEIPGITKTNHFGVKLSYHTITLESSDSNNEFSGDVLAIEGLFSGDKIGESELSWYANFGLHSFDFEDNLDETELGFGAGVFSDTSFGQFYAGVDLIDELTFGFGIRYHLQ